MSNAPEILETQSPYWLRLYGHWIHLDGIMPINDVEPGRSFSELVTVDGYRYEQRAPRGARTWELPYRYGTAAATAALESAAYDVAYNDDPSGRTLLLDTNQAKVNMIPPEFPETEGFDLTTRSAIAAGGVWQPSYAVTGVGVYVPVRAGVTYTAAVWTTALVGAGVLQISKSGDIPPTNFFATGSGTNADPELISTDFTPASDGEVLVFAVPGASDRSTAGMMVFEGDCPPEFYRRGRRMPCEVSVHDPKLTNNLIWRYCDPCKLPREHAQFVINEVGVYPATASVA